VFLKAKHGYVGFIDERPLVNAHGTTIEEARQTLVKVAAVAFDEERRVSRGLTAGREVREAFVIPAAAA
jgi:predicted RNase H-like HicB family nuclease